MLKLVLAVLLIPCFSIAAPAKKINKAELQNMMDLYINQVSRGTFTAIPHTEEFKTVLEIDKDKFKDCAKAICKVKFIKEPTLIDMGGEETVRMNVQVLNGKKALGEANTCYFAIYQNKKPVLDSYATDCNQ